jgi:AcrR family transcriptional regulator
MFIMNMSNPPELTERGLDEAHDDDRTTRGRLLAAGVELMLERPIGTGLSHVKATEVSKRAGLSHGAFYHHWPSQDDFQAELVEHVLDLGRSSNEVASFMTRMAEVDQGQPAESIRRAMNSSAGEMDFIPWRLWLALVARNDPNIDARLADRYHSVADAYVPNVEAVFDAFGLHTRPPIDVQRLVVLVDALWEGLALRRMIAPDLVDGQQTEDDSGNTWSLYALGVGAILLGALDTDDGSRESLTEAIEHFVFSRRE